ncbi:MAG: DNA-binding transcriptional regulator Fis [Halieaceae bacterium]|jgi:Fis family transcriptional regulator|nr:DNA-binding transcriptional regulator Fis [Halieaceae bacterium]
MRVGETLAERKPNTSLELPAESGNGKGTSLRHSVQLAVRAYLDELEGELGSEVYQMVLAEVEAPLLEEIMHYTRNNQTKASQMLGLNRGTLRKKLKQYGLLTDS